MTTVDLHIHTTATPYHATWTPTALAAAAATQGLAVIAATDHNTTASVSALQAAGAQIGVRVLSGVEVDSTAGGKLWHILLYHVPPTAPALIALCESVLERNLADAQRLIADLSQQGFVLHAPDAESRLFPDMIRRPNVADVATTLARYNDLPGRVVGEDDEAAGMRYLLTHMPGTYRPPEVATVIATAHQLGGIAVLAHPGRRKGVYAIPATEADIADMVAIGLDGLEVYYPTHTPTRQALYTNLAHRYNLCITGGSDSHHPHQALAHWEATRLERLWERLGISFI